MPTMEKTFLSLINKSEGLEACVGVDSFALLQGVDGFRVACASGARYEIQRTGQSAAVRQCRVAGDLETPC